MWSEEVVFDQVEHLLELTEDEDAMLRDGFDSRIVVRWRCSDSTVEEDLSSAQNRQLE